uniref:Cytochrome P450 n=1 Tax=Quercus lobata TaxID=97700 RepID=A0A7N2MDN0_QUELO
MHLCLHKLLPSHKQFRAKMWVFVACLTAILVKLGHWIYTQTNPKCNGILPPGSMGFPIIGETIEFFSPYSLHDIPPFVRKRMARLASHGSVLYQ